MVRTHYPSYLKTVLKAGSIVSLLYWALCLNIGWVHHRELAKNSRVRRRFVKAGGFDSFLQMRDEYHKHQVRPMLDFQPNQPYATPAPLKPQKHF
ncbi:unnamed protein product [Blepharisma stoltei]|uniref:Uncharacterized protein n=1 Tax=Blepharisma stoltei TaxID=1481888 RepID=A0AAU9JBR8_9CILI|nr:unnamed protein product [Blepharisma stoltei]